MNLVVNVSATIDVAAPAVGSTRIRSVSTAGRVVVEALDVVEVLELLVVKILAAVRTS